MNDKRTLLDALRNLKVQTGSLACMGCGWEHNCGTQGCAVLRRVETALAISSAFRCKNCDFWTPGDPRCKNAKSVYAGCTVGPKNYCDSCSLDLLTASEAARSDLAKKMASAAQQNEQLSQGAAMMTKKLSDTLEELAQVKAERDALLQVLKEEAVCEYCKHEPTPLHPTY